MYRLTWFLDETEFHFEGTEDECFAKIDQVYRDFGLSEPIPYSIEHIIERIDNK